MVFGSSLLWFMIPGCGLFYSGMAKSTSTVKSSSLIRYSVFSTLRYLIPVHYCRCIVYDDSITLVDRDSFHSMVLIWLLTFIFFDKVKSAHLNRY